MKKLRSLYIFILVLIFLLLISCNKSTDYIDANNVNNNDLIEYINIKKNVKNNINNNVNSNIKNNINNNVNSNMKKNINNNINTLNIKKKKYIEINYEGANINDRYSTPTDYIRIKVANESFGEYLRYKKLKSYGSKAMYYNGRVKSSKSVYDSVYDYAIGNKNLHQAADAIMYLKADYLFNNHMYNNIYFSFVNGFKAEYSKWMTGFRIRVNDNTASWHKDANQICTYENFLKFMNMIYSYCSTISLFADMTSVNLDDMQIGDVFIHSKMSGHAVIVVDMAVNSKTGQKIFMLAQSGSPAQQTQILINPNNSEISPWYEISTLDEIITPEWTFLSSELMRFK